jgi:SecY interacting protein Syd
MNREVAEALQNLLAAKATPIEYDPEWLSPCIIFPPDADGMVLWKPSPIEPPVQFSDIPLHPDLKAFYGAFWGGTVDGHYSGETVLVRVAWNSQELAIIQAVISTQIAERLPVSIAITGSDWYFGVDNDTGKVWLCEPGHPPLRQVSSSITTFLTKIE